MVNWHWGYYPDDEYLSQELDLYTRFGYGATRVIAYLFPDNHMEIWYEHLANGVFSVNHIDYID